MESFWLVYKMSPWGDLAQGGLIFVSYIAHNIEGHCKHDTARPYSGWSSMSIPV